MIMKIKEHRKNIILCEIEKTLNSLDDLSKGKNTFHSIDSGSDDFTVWERSIELTTRQHKRYLYILPKTNKVNCNTAINKLKGHVVELEDVFFIDVFENYSNGNNVISTTEFFKMLFNIDGYSDYLNNEKDSLRINRLYIDRKIISLTSQQDLQRDDLEVQTILNNWSLNKSLNELPILLLGDRGMGKSWVVKKFCLTQLHKSLKNPWLYPPAIYIDLSFLSDGFSQQSSVLDAILYHLKSLYNIQMLSDYYIWETFLRVNRIILVLDGFDEMTKEINEEIMFKNIWEIFSIVNKSTKVILTSRTNHFNSRSKILKHFSYFDYVNSSNQDNGENEVEYSEVGTRIRKNFNIFELTKLHNKDLKDLLIKYGIQRNLVFNNGIKQLRIIKRKAAKWNLEYEIEEISTIPAIYDTLIKILGNPSISLINTYKSVLLSAIIEYNIDTNRAIKNLITIVNKKLNNWDLSAQKKLNILSEIAWYMFERNYDYFMFERIPTYIRDKFGLNFELTINDIRTQTVIALYEENRYTFITQGVYAYLASLHICELLIDQNIESNYKGLDNLGRYDLSKTDIGNRILAFLKEEISDSVELKEKLKKIITGKIENSIPYSVWTKYLIKNCEKLGVSLQQIKLKDYWTRKPIDYDDNMVLIASKEFDPFFMSINEITNKFFEKFLLDSVEPKTVAEYDDLISKFDESYPGYFWKRRTDSRLTNIHKTLIENYDSQLWEHNNNPFRAVKNDYHLMLWADGNPPKNRKDHPVVYISWFAAAYFCNWLSVKHSLPPFYIFILLPKESVKEGQKEFEVIVRKNTQSHGYRLPSAHEWKFIAQEGNVQMKFPWDKYEKNGVLTSEGNKYMQSLLKEQPETFPVRSDEQNIFGITGLIGNVREWVDRSKVEEIKSHRDLGFIKGATWLLGKDGFDFNNLNSVFAENTNLDVGFRIARSLSASEKKIIENALS